MWSSDSRPAYRGMCALHSCKLVPRCTAGRAEGGWLLTEESELKARWAGYCEWLYQADPPVVELDVRGVTIPIVNAPFNCESPSFVEIQAAVNRLKGYKATGLCGIHAELLDAGGKAVLGSLHAILCSVWNTGIIPTDWKRGLVVPLSKGKGDRTATTAKGVTLLSLPSKVLAWIIILSGSPPSA